MLWCVKVAPASAFSFLGSLKHFPQKWEKQSETALINETQYMWLYKLTQITFVLLFLSSWKTKSQVIRLTSSFVTSLPWHCKPLRQMVLHCSAACHGCENPTVSTAPSTCLATPRLSLPPHPPHYSLRHCFPLRHSLVWFHLRFNFHKIIQEQSSYIYIYRRKKSWVIP